MILISMDEKDHIFKMNMDLAPDGYIRQGMREQYFNISLP